MLSHRRRLRRLVESGEVAAALLAMLVTLAAPARSLDDSFRGTLLGIAGSRTPPAHVVGLTIDPRELRDGACSERLRSVLERGHPRALLLWGPVSEACPAANEISPVFDVSRKAVLFTSDGHARGWLPDAATARALGVERTDWTLTARADALPGAHLADLADGRVDPGILTDHVVVASLATSDAVAEEAAEVAVAIDAVLGKKSAHVPSRLASSLAALLFASALLLARRARRKRVTIGAVVAGFIVAQALLLGLAGAVLPLPSMLLALAAGLAVAIAPVAVRRFRDVERTGEVLARKPALVRSDAEFFAELVRAVQRLEPCDLALVADVSAETERLRFWSADGLATSLVSEDACDSRAAPFLDEDGVARARVVRGLLQDRDEAVVLVPLRSMGVTEGCLILAGNAIVTAHVDDPRRVDRLAKEVTAWLCLRRVENLHPVRSDSLTSGAAALADEAELLGRVLREAPIPMLEADETGRVRRVGRAMSQALATAGVALPRAADEGLLAPGTLGLETAVAALTGLPAAGVAKLLVDVTASAEAIVVDAPNGPPGHALSLRVLRREIHQVSPVVSWIASLVPVASERPSLDNLRPLADTSALAVHSAWEATSNAVDAAATAANAPVRLGSARVTAHIISQRAIVFPALTEFLSEAAKLAPAGEPPVVSVLERTRSVDVVLLDLHLDLPLAVLQRVVDAPSAAPRELEPLAKLVRAVGQSQGVVRARVSGGLGAQIVLSFVRARVPAAARSQSSLVDPVELATVEETPRKRRKRR